MKKLANHNWLLITITSVILTLLGAWCIDISVSAMLSGGTLTNGWSTQNPMLMYHIALYLIIITVAYLAFITAYLAHEKIRLETRYQPINETEVKTEKQLITRLTKLYKDNILSDRDDKTILDTLTKLGHNNRKLQ